MLVFYDSNSLDNDDDDDDDNDDDSDDHDANDDDDEEERGNLFKYEPCLGKVVKLYKLTMFGLFGAVLLASIIILIIIIIIIISEVIFPKFKKVFCTEKGFKNWVLVILAT